MSNGVLVTVPQLVRHLGDASLPDEIPDGSVLTWSAGDGKWIDGTIDTGEPGTDGVATYGPGTHSSRPDPSSVPIGSLFSCSLHSAIERSDGSAWTSWYVGGSSGPSTDITRVDGYATNYTGAAQTSDPIDVQAGDILVFVSQMRNGSGLTLDDVTLTELASYDSDTGDWCYVGWASLDGSETDVTTTVATVGTEGAWGFVVFRGAATPIGVATASNSRIAPSINATTAGSLLVCLYAEWFDGTPFVAPAGMSQSVAGGGAGEYVMIAHETVSIPGATGTRTPQAGGTGQGKSAVSLEIPEA